MAVRIKTITGGEGNCQLFSWRCYHPNNFQVQVCQGHVRGLCQCLAIKGLTPLACRTLPESIPAPVCKPDREP